MGNRANVIFVEGNGKDVEISCAVYLHWNGGLELTQHLSRGTKKVNAVTISKLLKDKGKDYSPGYEDKPKRTFENIAKFFLRHEAALAAATDAEEVDAA